jgi:uncharacterized membrane protein
MKPLVVLVSVFVISVFAIKLITKNYEVKLSARIGMCSMLLFTSIGHFAFTKGMAMMIPPIIPYKTEIIYITGILEIVLGIFLLIPQFSMFSGWTLIVLFVSLLPSNIYASINHIDYQKATLDGYGLEYLWFRIPLQLLFIAWTYLSTIKT